ncbi:hypothetical protein HYPSUDRAFT_147815 [Hypholoma sublateritium FD-334 SS-4]|uniref:Inorganic phosphate transporter n=1 Tax=Hypholoma sublateritium (strain FD-334 SS-4) TaxID=945553 RepID=A0A0D2P7P6_HYPSF|nr:hypothetical protein HYPSUDRAFT_147815 [Hypholoma sublateritium FD-334 SS-4]
MNAAVQNMVISLGAMQVARKIPFDDPIVLNYVRIGYVFSQLLALGTYFYLSRVIKQKNDKTVLRYAEPPSPLDGEKVVVTTIRDYDLAETKKLLRSVYMGVAMMGVMHIYFHFTQPLFIQGLMGLKNIYDAPLVSIHLLGKPAVDSLARPFKVASMLGGKRLSI